MISQWFLSPRITPIADCGIKCQLKFRIPQSAFRNNKKPQPSWKKAGVLSYNGSARLPLGRIENFSHFGQVSWLTASYLSTCSKADSPRLPGLCPVAEIKTGYRLEAIGYGFKYS